MERVQNLKIGEKAWDGSIYAGDLPTGEKIFVMPRDVTTTVTFNQAAQVAATFNAKQVHYHDDWQVPTEEMLKIICESQNKGALAGTFKTKSRMNPVAANCYWFSAGGDGQAAVLWGKGPSLVKVTDKSLHSCRLARLVKPQ